MTLQEMLDQAQAMMPGVKLSASMRIGPHDMFNYCLHNGTECVLGGETPEEVLAGLPEEIKARARTKSLRAEKLRTELAAIELERAAGAE